MKPECAEPTSRRASWRVRTAQWPALLWVSASVFLSARARASATLLSHAVHAIRQALICRCSGRSTLFLRWLTFIRAGNLPPRAGGRRDGVFPSVLTTPVRNEWMISGPVAPRALYAGRTTSSACRKCRGALAISSTERMMASARDRRYSSRARGGGRFPRCRAILLRKALSAKSALLSSSTSCTMRSKSPRVSLRMSGSVVISKRRRLVPGIRSRASTTPA